MTNVDLYYTYASHKFKHSKLIFLSLNLDYVATNLPFGRTNAF